MKKSILLLLSVVLIFAACSKDEETITSISGQLSAGENVTANELIGLPLALGQFKSDGDISNTSLDPSTFDVIDIVMLDAMGTFEFTNVSPGNYFIGLNEFIFTTDTVCRFRFDGTEALNIIQTIIRNPADNFISIFPPCTSNFAKIDMTNYSGPELTHIIAHGYIIGNGELATEDRDFEAIDGIITINCTGSTTNPQCTSGETFKETHFVFGFADGNGGTVYSEKFEFKTGSDSCEGLPQTIGQTTISYISATGYYALTNN
jgi:hypothetical protein